MQALEKVLAVKLPPEVGQIEHLGENDAAGVVERAGSHEDLAALGNGLEPLRPDDGQAAHLELRGGLTQRYLTFVDSDPDRGQVGCRIRGMGLLESQCEQHGIAAGVERQEVPVAGVVDDSSGEPLAVLANEFAMAIHEHIELVRGPGRQESGRSDEVSVNTGNLLKLRIGHAICPTLQFDGTS